MAEDNKTLYLTMVVGLLAVVAIVVGAVAIARTGPSAVTVNAPSSSGGGGARPAVMPQGGPGQQPQQPMQAPAPIYITPNGGAAGGGMAIDAGGAAFPVGTSGRIYTLAIGHDYGSHEYFDDKGYLSGFGIGIVDLVCEEAGIDCRMVWDRYDNCWDSQIGQHATGGQGLHDRWYDGCTGWYTTIERIHVFGFSTPYLKEPKVNFYVLKGRTFNTDKNTIMGKRILFLEGWASDEKCLFRETGVELTTSNAAYVTDNTKAVDMLRNDNYDAIFTTQTTVQGDLNSGTLEALSKEYSCMVAGNAIMTRKDSDLPSQWNRGFNKVRTNGRFKKYCDQANDEHSAQGHLTCIDAF